MTALFTHSDFLLHETPPGHPESPDRIEAVSAHLKSLEVANHVTILEPNLIETDVIRRVHRAEYSQAIERAIPTEGLVRIDADTSMGPNSWNASRRAIGAVVAAVKESLEGNHRRSFCVVRPPGHHAESWSGMGFCLFNSIAIAADVALDSVDRVAILDFDVHHGNGTVEIFADNPNVLVCSSFQFPFYPNRMHDVDRPNIVNTPLAAGTDGSEFRQAIEADWVEPLRQHRPDLLLVSAGFDAHDEDPLAELRLQDSDYQWITEWIVDAANTYCEGRVVSALEGGYSLEALARCCALHLQGLL